VFLHIQSNNIFNEIAISPLATDHANLTSDWCGVMYISTIHLSFFCSETYSAFLQKLATNIISLYCRRYWILEACIYQASFIHIIRSNFMQRILIPKKINTWEIQWVNSYACAKPENRLTSRFVHFSHALDENETQRTQYNESDIAQDSKIQQCGVVDPSILENQSSITYLQWAQRYNGVSIIWHSPRFCIQNYRSINENCI